MVVRGLLLSADLEAVLDLVGCTGGKVLVVLVLPAAAVVVRAVPALDSGRLLVEAGREAVVVLGAVGSVVESPGLGLGGHLVVAPSRLAFTVRGATEGFALFFS